MLTQAPRGTKDVLPADSYRWQYVESKMRQAAAEAGFREVRTPVFEHTELFLRGVGDTTDIVQKEMYTFKDKGDRSITLKPEGTAGAARCLLENNLYADTLPCKMYYLNAPIFRYEAPQSGRLREHHQFGLECFGARDASADAELILLAYRLLSGLGVKNLSVNINSIGCPNCRPKYHATLKSFLSGRIGEMCSTCQTRFDRNPLRVLDCKEKHCQELVADAPSMLDLLCDDCKAHFAQLQSYLDAAHIPYQIDPRIVRGLDYYTKTVFELITKTENGNLTVCGGGRYDNLVEELGGPSLHAVGFGMGIERVLMLLDSEGVVIPKPTLYDVFVTYMGAHQVEAFSLVQKLRDAGFKADMDHTGRSLKAQFKYANKMGATLTATLGDEEIASGVVKVKNMATKEEQTIALETMAGKGSELGWKFEQMRWIIDHARYGERLGVCMDTCHMHDAGYDVQDLDGLLAEFDRVIGIQRIAAVHVNDSRNVRGARKDRHANIGFGEIGFDALSAFVHHPALADIVKILETPYVEGHAPYGEEIAMLRQNTFDPSLMDQIRRN